MIGHCFNPDCKEELRYLRQGSVYQLETGFGREFHWEFFWLCPICSITFKVSSDDKGGCLYFHHAAKRRAPPERLRRDPLSFCSACTAAVNHMIDYPGGVVSATIRQAQCPVMTVPPDLSR